MSEVKLRIEQDLKDKLKKEAQNQKRSLNNLIEVILSEFMDEITNHEDSK